MRPSKLSLVSMFEKQRRYAVPLLQRPYVWGQGGPLPEIAKQGVLRLTTYSRDATTGGDATCGNASRAARSTRASPSASTSRRRRAFIAP
jgi:hypothetical protein